MRPKLALACAGLLSLQDFAAQAEKLEASHATAGTTPAFPLKLSADQRYLVDQNNRPFLLIGDSPWSLIVEPTPEQVDRYLDDRAAKGFNALLVNLSGTNDWLLILETVVSGRASHPRSQTVAQ